MKKLIIAVTTLLAMTSMTTDNVRYYTASYYSSKYEGRKTASGEIFSQTKLTAASNNYPLGTTVKVTNTSNGKEVIVKINDRMDKKYSHRIDLSKRAFAELENPKKGIIKEVKVETL